jgi:hypothetical protein
MATKLLFPLRSFFYLGYEIDCSAQIAAQEASADGINWTFSPMVDVSRDPRWEEFLKVLVKMLI